MQCGAFWIPLILFLALEGLHIAKLHDMYLLHEGLLYASLTYYRSSSTAVFYYIELKDQKCRQ